LEESVRDGKYYKVFREYYGNQLLCLETTYIGKKKNGYMKKWYDSGVPKKYVEYADNKMNGIFQRWYDNGQLRMSGEYLQGKRIGTWKYWKKDGTIYNELTY
jgi:antitoxin component YwqK of YwqJK toxin-antitoxin module